MIFSRVPPALLALAMAWHCAGMSKFVCASEHKLSGQPAQTLRLDGANAAERAAALLKYVAGQSLRPRDELYPKASAPAYAARLVLNIDTEYALRKLNEAVTSRIDKAGSGSARSVGAGSHALDPFDKVALVNTYFLARERIPQATAQKIRDYVALYAHRQWRGYGAMNYRLMMDGAGFLAAEEWPELKDADGLNAEQIRTATRERLLGYFSEICLRNYHEYGSPIYSAVNLSAIRMLAEFARDPVVRHRATLTLDAMFVDIASSWNQGYNAGTAARAKYWSSTDTSPEAMGATAAAAWIWFGAPRSIAADGTGWIHSLWMATPGKYSLPEIVVAVAQDRSRPSVYRGSVLALAKDHIHRTTYHSPGYSLSSQWDHPATPTAALYKESRRNMLKWASDCRSSTFAVCMENPRRPYNLAEGVANALGYGENPFSQYLQHEGTLIGVYAVPNDYPYYRLYAPFTTGGATLKRLEKSGWVCCHNGSMLLGFYCAKPWSWGKKPWNGNDMLWCDARKNGWIVETSETGPFSGGGAGAELDRFAEALSRRTTIDGSQLDLAEPRLRYRSLSGALLELTWLPHAKSDKGHARINNQPLDYDNWPLHQSPMVCQEVGSALLRITDGSRTLQYDFNQWTLREVPAE